MLALVRYQLEQEKNIAKIRFTAALASIKLRLGWKLEC